MSSLDGINVAKYRCLEGIISHRFLAQEFTVVVMREQLALRDAFKEFVKIKLGVPGPDGLDLSDVVHLSEQVTVHHHLSDGIALLYYVFDMKPENCRKEITRLLAIAGFKMDHLIDQVHFVHAEDILGLQRGTLCDLSRVYKTA